MNKCVKRVEGRNPQKLSKKYTKVRKFPSIIFAEISDKAV